MKSKLHSGYFSIVIVPVVENLPVAHMLPIYLSRRINLIGQEAKRSSVDMNFLKQDISQRIFVNSAVRHCLGQCKEGGISWSPRVPLMMIRRSGRCGTFFGNQRRPGMRAMKDCRNTMNFLNVNLIPLLVRVCKAIRNLQEFKVKLMN